MDFGERRVQFADQVGKGETGREGDGTHDTRADKCEEYQHLQARDSDTG